MHPSVMARYLEGKPVLSRDYDRTRVSDRKAVDNRRIMSTAVLIKAFTGAQSPEPENKSKESTIFD